MRKPEANSKFVILCIYCIFMITVIPFCMYDASTRKPIFHIDKYNAASEYIPSSIPDDGIFTFIAYGDTRSGSPGNVSPLHEEIVGLYLDHDPELILHVGDLVYHGGEWYQYADFNEWRK